LWDFVKIERHLKLSWLTKSWKIEEKIQHFGSWNGFAFLHINQFHLVSSSSYYYTFIHNQIKAICIKIQTHY
jgi:hypothetical protein